MMGRTKIKITVLTSILLAYWVLGASGAGLVAWGSPAQSEKDPQRLAKQAFEHFYNLEYDPAIAIFEKLRDADPNNPTWHNQVAIAYFYKQLYVAGVLQGDLFSASNKFFRKKVDVAPLLKDRFWKANETAIRLCEQRLKKDKNDQEALYACGIAYATRSTYQGLIERAKLAFIGSANKANEYHSRLLELNPRYYDAYLLPGVYDFVLGSLPAPLRFLLFFTGLSGDKERGLRSVESTAQWGERAREDAKILLTVMYRREKRFVDARRTVAELSESFPRNYILPLEIASLYRAAGEEEEAIRGYAQVLEDVHRGAPGYSEAPVARIHFELGELYRKAGELESAREHFGKVAGSQGSTPELEKESATIREQIEQLLQQVKPSPSGAAGSDSVALRDASSGQ